MPPRAFTLQIPADARYADIAGDAARKFVELMGGAAAEGAALADALVEAIHATATAGAPLSCAFSLQAAGVEVVVTTGVGGSSVVRQPLTAGRE